MTLRSATAADRPFLRRLFEEVRARDIEAWGPLAGTLVPMQLQAQEASYAATFPGAAHDIIECGGEPVGRCIVWRTDDEVRLVDIGLLASYRGRGLGTSIIAALRDEAVQNEKPLRLHVDMVNEGARRLYERLGLRVTHQVGPQWAMALESPRQPDSQ